MEELNGVLNFGVSEEQKQEAIDHPESVIENNIAFKTLGLTAKEVEATTFEGAEVFKEIIEFIKTKKEAVRVFFNLVRFTSIFAPSGEAFKNS